MAAHAWWRIKFTSKTNIYISCAEVQFRAVVGGPSLCVGGVASASENFPGNTPANAFDGNAATPWSTNGSGVPQWLAYHFPAAVSVDEVMVRVRSDVSDQMPGAMTFEWSDDGAAWTADWNVAAVAWVAGQTRTFARPVTDGVLSGSMPLPLRLTGSLVTGRVLSASMPLPLRVAGSVVTSRTLTASMPLPLALLARMVNRDRWRSLEVDPATAWVRDDLQLHGGLNAGIALARPADISHLLVPDPADLLKVPDQSGLGNHANYSLPMLAANVKANPPEITLPGGVDAHAPFAAAMPLSFSVHQFARAKASDSYLAALIASYDVGAPGTIDNPLLMRLWPTEAFGYVVTGAGANFLRALVNGVNEQFVANDWHDEALVVTPARIAYFLDGVLRATVAGPIATGYGTEGRPYFNLRWVLSYQQFPGTALGVTLIYNNVALADAEVAQNSNALRGLYGYPNYIPQVWSEDDLAPVTAWSQSNG